MNIFEFIPNKKLKGANYLEKYPWPELGDTCEMNLFYREFSSAEGWIGDGYIAIWRREEIEEFRRGTIEVYGERYHFFASDGGGTQFGFFYVNGLIIYISAPDIGEKEDVKVLGVWDEFLESVSISEYI